MANVIYPLCKQAMWAAGINASSDAVKIDLIDLGTYTYSAAHDFYDDVTALTTPVATSGAVTSKTFTNGTFDHADNASMWTSVSGATVEALIWWQDTAGAASTDPLLVFMDSVTGLALTPNGGDVGLTLNASGVCAL